MTATTTPIGPYRRQPAEVLPWDPRLERASATVIALIEGRRPDLVVHHMGSTAVPGLPGKNVLDFGIAATPDLVPGIVLELYGLGFGPQVGPDPWPPTRPMLVGSIESDGAIFRIHCHVQPDATELARDLAFRDALRADAALRDAYAAVKTGIVADGQVDSLVYSYRKQAWIASTLAGLGFGLPAIEPPATIGILGGGQLGRMLGLAAAAMGYRIAVLDPDPSCPASTVADAVVVGGYDDVEGALRLAERCAVVTYELEHVDAGVVEALDAVLPVRPGRYPLVLTQDRLRERRFVEGEGIAVAPWREVRTTDELRAAVAPDILGLPVRLKVATGGYDGRGQVRIASADDVETAIDRLDRPSGEALLVERELDFAAEGSVVIARGLDGRSTAFQVARNVHDDGILIESVVPAPFPDDVAERAVAIAERLATGMGLVGTLTVELFLLADGSLVVNELAPRVHNSGHWTIEGAATSQFEQHIRAICGLGLGSTAALSPAAMVNLLGRGPRRPAKPTGVADALAEPDVHLHLYDKQEVFERRKMGHLTALGPDVETALERARTAAARIGWADADDADDIDEEDGRVTDQAPIRVGVVGGSRSDFPTLQAAVDVLAELGVAAELTVVSAHRTPDRLFRYAEQAAGRGIRVIVAGAGGAAHLPGMLAAKTTLPVIGVPIPTEHLGGLDSLLSIVQMPRGIPVATVAIGNATNAGLLAAAILALSDPALAERLAAWRTRQTQAVIDDAPPTAAG